MTTEFHGAMGRDWPAWLAKMHERMGFTAILARFGPAELASFLEFRRRFLAEELSEMTAAIEAGDAEGIVDALIDLCVVAIGTLDAYGVDAHQAWRAVMTANLVKRPGVKPGRPNPTGLPDLLKPSGWTPPSHAGNVGRLPEALGTTATKVDRDESDNEACRRITEGMGVAYDGGDENLED